MNAFQSATAYLTDFADEAVVIPGVLCVAIVFVAAGWLRGALVWMAGIAGTLGLMLVLKLAFTACGGMFGGSIASPSGHTAAAAVFYGTLLALAVRRRSASLLGEAGSVVGAAVIVGASRLLLGVHTLPEVLLGGAVGTAGALAILGTIGRPPEPHRRVAPLLLSLLPVLIALHGQRMPAEAAIRAAVLDIWPLSACREARQDQGTARWDRSVATTSRARHGLVV